MLKDRTGVALKGSGMSSSLRDLARVGELVRLEGRFNGKQLLQPGTVAELKKGGDPAVFKAGRGNARDGSSYHDFWWIAQSQDGTLEARGLAGQHIYVDQANELVVAKFSADAKLNPTPSIDQNAFAAIANAVKGRWTLDPGPWTLTLGSRLPGWASRGGQGLPGPLGDSFGNIDCTAQNFREVPPMSEPIHLVVTLQVKPGHLDRLKQATAELVAASRQEAGCVSYGAAYAEDGVTAYIIEHWKDQAALDAHNKTAHFIDGVKKLQDACSTLQIHRVHWQG